MSKASGFAKEAIELRLNQQADKMFSEQAMAVLLLLNLGYSPEDIKRIFPEVSPGLADLTNAHVSLDAPPKIKADGLRFFPHNVRPEQRCLANRLKNRAHLEPNAISLIVYKANETNVEIRVTEHAALLEMTAERLVGDGVQKGDTIAVTSNVQLESVLLSQAAWEIGAAVVFIRDVLTRNTLQLIADRLCPKIWFLNSEVSAPKGQRVIHLGAGSTSSEFDVWINECQTKNVSCPGAPEDTAVIFTTSGSSGAPKLIAIPQRSLFHGAHLATASGPKLSRTVQVSATDLSAPSGLRSLAVLSLMPSHTSVVASPDPQLGSLAWFDVCSRTGATHLQAVPATLRAGAALGARRWADLGLEALSVVASGTGVLHQSVRDAFASVYRGDILDYYGMSETGGLFTWCADNVIANGSAIPANTLMQIVRDDHTPVAQGETGLIRLFNEGLYSADLSVDPPTKLRGGWFTTGDLGRWCDNGIGFQVVGRNHDLIKTQEGEFVSPVAIEDAVLRNPGIRAAVVIGLVVDEAGDSYGLALETDVCEKEIKVIAHDCITKEFGPYALPRTILTFKDLPRTAHGKPDRKGLSRKIEEKLSM